MEQDDSTNSPLQDNLSRREELDKLLQKSKEMVEESKRLLEYHRQSRERDYASIDQYETYKLMSKKE